jgi:amidohydrolase
VRVTAVRRTAGPPTCRLQGVAPPGSSSGALKLVDDILRRAAELASIRRDLHRHPETECQEVRTSALVAERLAAWGIEVHTGIGKTGVVGIVRGSAPGAAIGLRADMDALPMEEAPDQPCRSTRPGAFHGCGHDGHTTMLLGAAQYLAETRRFPGEIVLIFQPGEEGGAGARAMIADGLFRRFRCDEVYALHNWPGGPLGQVVVKPGLAMAAYDSFDITVTGRGSHAAMPHLGRDAVVTALTIGQALQTIVSRNVDPLKSAVVSLTQVHAGSAYKVIPETARLCGTIRTFDPEVRALVAERIRALATGVALGFAAEAEVVIEHRFSALRNHEELVQAVLDVAREVVGDDLAGLDDQPKTGSEDFADMLEAVPGVYLWLRQGDGPGLHTPRYAFNDELLPIGASLLARLAERRAAALAPERRATP